MRALGSAGGAFGVGQEAFRVPDRHEGAGHCGHAGDHAADVHVADAVRCGRAVDVEFVENALAQQGDVGFAGVAGGQDAKHACQNEGSGSFLKKRTKKLLHDCRRLVRDSRAKVFASFFKKKRFL
jgi:hypothetical protein